MRAFTLNGIVLLALAAAFYGVATDWKLLRPKTPAPPASTEKADWCVEHEIAESECFI